MIKQRRFQSSRQSQSAARLDAHNIAGRACQRAPWLLLCLTLCLNLLLAPWNALWAQNTAQVEARVDRLHVTDAESFTLILELKDGTLTESPDLSVLNENFHILRTSTQTSMQLVNGQSSRSVQIHVALQAKQVGRLTIPPIKIAGSQTQPITITVSNTPDLADSSGQNEVIIEVDAQPKAGGKLYVQQQLSLVVRLFYPDGLTQGTLDHPEIENTVVELLDELKYTSRRGNQSYNVLERRYAIQPERSGALEIPPVRFEGRISRASRSFFSAPVGRRIRAASDAIHFTVSAQPDSFTGSQWIPARSLVLSMSQDQVQARVGEPITRIISLRGVGLSHTQLPDLPQIDVQGGRVYPDPGEGSTGRNEGWMVAQRQFQQAIVPSKVGKLSIPESRIEWWDVLHDRQETLVIPGLDLDVLPALGEAAPAQAAAGVNLLPADESQNGIAVATPHIVVDAGWWPWLTAIFATLWLITLLLWWRLGGPQRAPQQSATVVAPNLKASLDELRRTCTQNQAAAARQALLRWGAARWPGAAPVSVQELAQRCHSEELQRAVAELQAASYGQQGGAWQGERLWQAVNQLPATLGKVTKPNDEPLPPLYPQRS